MSSGIRTVSPEYNLADAEMRLLLDTLGAHCFDAKMIVQNLMDLHNSSKTLSTLAVLTHTAYLTALHMAPQALVVDRRAGGVIWEPVRRWLRVQSKTLGTGKCRCVCFAKLACAAVLVIPRLRHGLNIIESALAGYLCCCVSLRSGSEHGNGRKSTLVHIRIFQS